MSPKPGGGCADNGPGVLPEPGDRTSSFIPPGYESDELGGLCKIKEKKSFISKKNCLSCNYHSFILVTYSKHLRLISKLAPYESISNVYGVKIFFQ